MLFIIIGIVFSLIFIIAFFGDYKQKEIDKDYEKFNNMMNR